MISISSEKMFLEIRQIAEEILQELELPYRIIETCTGDMGSGKYRMQDIEVWMPGRGKYGETHSCSNLTDWQARRANIRYRDHKGEIHYVHCLNNTTIALPRILIAIIENYQQEDGSVRMPQALQQWVGKEWIRN